MEKAKKSNRRLSSHTQSLVGMILELNGKGLNPTAISKQLPKSPDGKTTSKDTVIRVLSKHGVEKNNRNESIRSSDYEEFEKLLLEGKEPFTTLVRKMNLSIKKCKEIASKHGISIGQESRAKTKILSKEEVVRRLNDGSCQYLGFKNGYYHFVDDTGFEFKKTSAKISQGNPKGKLRGRLSDDEIKLRIGSNGTLVHYENKKSITITCINGHKIKTRISLLNKQKCQKCVGMIRAKIGPDAGLQIKSLHDQGYTPVQIVKKISHIVSVSSSAIRLYLKRVYDVDPNRRGLVDRSRKCVICGTVFVPGQRDGPDKAKYKTCSQECKNKSRALSVRLSKCSEQQLQQIIDLRNQKHKLKDISKITGVAFSLVKTVLIENGLAKSFAEVHGCTKEELDLKYINAKSDLEKGDGVLDVCKKYNLTMGSLYSKAYKDGWSNLVSSPNRSILETEIFDFIKSISPHSSQIMSSNRAVIAPMELDIVDPVKKIAVEFCGIYWHSEEVWDEDGLVKPGKNAKYHFNKMKAAEEAGYRLITIFEDEWHNRKDQCKNFLRSVFGSSKTVGARKTEVCEIPGNEALSFLDKNHIQGGNRSSDLYVGLRFNGDLIAVIAFGRHHRGGDSGSVVLNRMAFADGISISGGASKMLKFSKSILKNKGVKRIISWSDNRWSVGDVYQKLNFSLEASLVPDYSYCDFGSILRKSKQGFKKSRLQALGGVGVTEHEMALSLNMYRIYDCGKKRWSVDIV